LAQTHEELVVRRAVIPALEEFDDVLEVEEPDAGALDGEAEPDDLPLVVALFAAAVLARAGSLPVTSCARIPPELARNIAVAVAATRVRINLIRRLRA